MANYIATDTDLTAVANAIRTKGGTSASLEFPQGFVDAVNAIQTDTHPTDFEKYITADASFEYFESNITKLAESAFYNALVPLYINLPEVTTCTGENQFMGSKMLTLHIPKVRNIPTRMFQSATNIKAIALPSATSTGANVVFGCSELLVLDLGSELSASFGSNMCNQAYKLSTIILRRSNGITSMGAANSLLNTPFANGGIGGTIYIPKVLYDHLGDGSALDYQSATNWSTFHGYGTITWAKIEGSIYETQYADGYPVAS